MEADLEPNYYEYNRHKLMFDSSSDEDRDMVNWEDKIESVDLPLVVDMSHWIGCITRSVLPYDMFMDKITDGIILCNFGNTINAMTGFGARRQISSIMYPDTEGNSEEYQRHNIASFLQWCKTYGVNKEWLFSVSDLADKQDARKILRALLWIGRIAHRRGIPAPQIVKIEEKYGMRYYMFMKQLIAEPPIPALMLFKDDDENPPKEKRSSRISVTSFFGRRSSRNSVNSNLSVASRSSASNLHSVQEDRKKSIIGIGKKKKKKKDAVVEEPEFITANSDIQQIYLQIMTLMYHKGFQRAKPKGYINAAMEEWQTDLHLTEGSALPQELFEIDVSTLKSSRNISPSPASATFNLNSTPTSDFPLNTFSADPTLTGDKARIRLSVQEPDSSSDGAFADDDREHNVRKSPTNDDTFRESATGSPRITEIVYNIFSNSDEDRLEEEDGAPADRRKEKADRRGSGSGAGAGDRVKELNFAADSEILSITSQSRDVTTRVEDDDERTTSIHTKSNPKMDFDNVESPDITGIKRKDGSKRKHMKTPDPLEAAMKEQSIKDSDDVRSMPRSPGCATPRSRQQSEDRHRSFSRQGSGGGGGGGITLGQVLLLIVCPCKLCFGRRRS